MAGVAVCPKLEVGTIDAVEGAAEGLPPNLKNLNGETVLVLSVTVLDAEAGVETTAKDVAGRVVTSAAEVVVCPKLKVGATDAAEGAKAVLPPNLNGNSVVVVFVTFLAAGREEERKVKDVDGGDSFIPVVTTAEVVVCPKLKIGGSAEVLPPNLNAFNDESVVVGLVTNLSVGVEEEPKLKDGRGDVASRGGFIPVVTEEEVAVCPKLKVGATNAAEEAAAVLLPNLNGESLEVVSVTDLAVDKDAELKLKDGTDDVAEGVGSILVVTAAEVGSRF